MKKNIYAFISLICCCVCSKIDDSDFLHFLSEEYTTNWIEKNKVQLNFLDPKFFYDHRTKMQPFQIKFTTKKKFTKSIYSAVINDKRMGIQRIPCEVDVIEKQDSLFEYTLSTVHILHSVYQAIKDGYFLFIIDNKVSYKGKLIEHEYIYEKKTANKSEIFESPKDFDYYELEQMIAIANLAEKKAKCEKYAGFQQLEKVSMAKKTEAGAECMENSKAGGSSENCENQRFLLEKIKNLEKIETNTNASQNILKNPIKSSIKNENLKVLNEKCLGIEKKFEKYEQFFVDLFKLVNVYA